MAENTKIMCKTLALMVVKPVKVSEAKA